MYYQVRDLLPEQKRAAEILLGHAISDDDAVSIRSVAANSVIPSRLSPEERIEALRRLKERFASRERPPVSESEETEAVNEAMRASRPGYRSAT